MRKITKKVISIITSIILLMCLCTSTYAAENEVQPRITFVASMKIVSYTGGGISSGVGLFGHSFLIFTNTSDSPIFIGHMPVQPQHSITIGTFGNRSAHKGIWYNIEGYKGISCTTYALGVALTQTQLQSVNKTINSNDSWETFSNNCTSFAVKVWNAANSGLTVSGNNPTALVTSIKSKSNYLTNPTIPNKGIGAIARHTEDYYEYDVSGAEADT